MRFRELPLSGQSVVLQWLSEQENEQRFHQDQGKERWDTGYLSNFRQLKALDAAKILLSRGEGKDWCDLDPVDRDHLIYRIQTERLKAFEKSCSITGCMRGWEDRYQFLVGWVPSQEFYAGLAEASVAWAAALTELLKSD